MCIKEISVKDVLEVAQNYPAVAHILDYPRGSLKRVEKIARQLEKCGVRKIVLEGPVKIGKISILGKGCTSVVLKGVDEDNKVVALKIRRSDADRPDMSREASYLSLANTVGVGPRLFCAQPDVLVMEYIEGDELSIFILSEKSVERIRQVLLQLVQDCWKLDSIGLIHLELSRCKEHVIVRKQDGRPVIIDFETCSTTSKKSNVTQIIGGLFFSKTKIAAELRKRLDVSEADLLKAQELLRTYKSQRTMQVLRELLRTLKIHEPFP